MNLKITPIKIAIAVIGILFSQSSSAQTDTLMGITTPSGSGNNYKVLAHGLCDSLSNDQLKVNAIYNWITHNISYDVKAMEHGKLKEEDPVKVFKQKKGMCGGYSLLFAAMCNEVGIKALMIDGYSKDWMFDDGDKFYIPRHAWNVVYIDKRWRLIDATWGAGYLTQTPGWLKRKLNKASNNPLQTSGKLKFKFQYDTAYFLSDPLVFRLKHLPSDPVWQMTDSVMPLEVFEAGTIAIEKFNKAYPQLDENQPEQLKLSTMDERARIQASAQRTYDYNSRYYVALAAKHHADAMDTLASNENGTLVSAGLALGSVQEGLKNAEEEVKQQKKVITQEYNELSTKNKKKNLDAKQYIRELHSDNKRMIAQCESRIKRVNALTAAIDKKAGAAAKGSKEINANNLTAVATAKHQEDIQSVILTAMVDSVRSRKKRVDSIREVIVLQQNELKSDKEINSNRLDTLAHIFGLADSALTQETINRIQMHDNYDEEVLQWNRIVKSVRLGDVDSMQKDYFTAYDSINNQYETLRKEQWEQIQLCRKNITDLEHYKRKNNNPAFLNQYGTLVKTQDELMLAYYQNLAANKSYIQGHKALFGELIKLYKRQEELADYMEKSEQKRSDLEEKNLTKKEAFDKKENEKQKAQLQEAGKKAEKALSMK